MGKKGRSRSVPSDVYSTKYYHEINDSGAIGRTGSGLSPRLQYMADVARIAPTDKVLDIGCGSGELCMAAARIAKRVVGIDYSKDAIALCSKKLKRAPARLRSRIRFLRAGAADLRRLGEREFTVVLLTDVVEHLYPEELDKLLQDLHGVLAPGARVCIHTAPNLEFYRYGYPVIRAIYPILRRIPATRAVLWSKHNWKGRKSLPKDPEEGSHNKLGHVNEQTPRAMREVLVRNGYRARVYTLPFLRPVRGLGVRVLYAALKVPPLRQMFGADIVAIAQEAKR